MFIFQKIIKDVNNRIYLFFLNSLFVCVIVFNVDFKKVEIKIRNIKFMNKMIKWKVIMWVLGISECRDVMLEIGRGS